MMALRSSCTKNVLRAECAAGNVLGIPAGTKAGVDPYLNLDAISLLSLFFDFNFGGICSSASPTVTGQVTQHKLRLCDRLQ